MWQFIYHKHKYTWKRSETKIEIDDCSSLSIQISRMKNQCRFCFSQSHATEKQNEKHIFNDYSFVSKERSSVISTCGRRIQTDKYKLWHGNAEKYFKTSSTKDSLARSMRSKENARESQRCVCVSENMLVCIFFGALFVLLILDSEPK